MKTSRRKFFAAAAAGLLAVPALLSADDRYDRERYDRERERERYDRDRYDRDRRDDYRRRERWVRLGERHVGRREELDIIDLNDKQRYTAVWFQVEEGALELDKIKITFGNKDTFTPATRLVFREGERTAPIELPLGDREITRIGFRYRGLSRREATIVAWGRVFDGDRR
jgi:hypothetical protein